MRVDNAEIRRVVEQWRGDGRRATRKRCEHPPLHAHKVGEEEWECSVCGKVAKWGKSWRWFGALECKRCWAAAVKFVTCSTECRREVGIKNDEVQG